MTTKKHSNAWMTAFASFVMSVTSLLGQAQSQWVPESSLDAGNVRQGELVERAFTVRNPGNSIAEISVVALSHPGMKIRVPRELKPQAAGQIVVTWDTRFVQGDATAQALLRIDDADTVLLSVSARVIPSIEILPYSAVFISGFRDENAIRTLEIVNHDPDPVNIVSISRENADSVQTYSVTLKTIASGRQYELNVELKSNASSGRSRDVLLLHTDHARFPVIRLPVNLFVKDDVYINPESVDFGQISGEAWSPETFLLNSRHGPIKVLSVTCDLPFVKVTVPASDAASTHEFRVEVEGKLPEGPFSGMILIRTDNPSFPEVRAPVQGEVLSGGRAPNSLQ